MNLFGSKAAMDAFLAIADGETVRRCRDGQGVSSPESEITSKLIFLSFAATEIRFWEGDDPLLTWDDAMGVYARAVQRESYFLAIQKADPEAEENVGGQG